MNSELKRRILVELDDAYTSKRAVNAECVSDRDLFNSYVNQLKNEGYIEAEVLPDMRGQGRSIYAVVTRGLTPAGRDWLATARGGQ